ncbi:Plasmodium vivax Vir protein, putative [Plasmodium vivax]|uniref:Vir protein, putative n=1 Tax=Plasmodium vivax TaxID=5855 RepID=A0A1G4EC93_PLAVI|nr:Plasmodium vivax Vir protein, putative [Plasmodium vivax]
MANILGDYRLGLLPTKYNYKKFDEEYGTCEGVNFYPEVTEELSTFEGFPEISTKILKAVCYVYNKSKRSTIDEDTCNFLYFWLGNILINGLNKKDFFSEVIISLYWRLNENNKQKVCNLPYARMGESDFKKTKLIFDIFQDYVNYKMDLARYNPPCNEEYNKYLTTYVDNYKQFYKECIKEHKSNVYCQEFNKYYNDEKHHNLLTWSCKITNNLHETDPLKLEAEGEEQKAQIDEGFGGARAQQPLQEINERAQAYEQIPDPFTPNSRMSENTAVSTSSDDTPPSIISKSVTGAVSVAGALVPSYLLYSYTPAGNLINKLLGRTTRTNHNPLMEEQLINNFYQPEQFNSERSGYNISYRPV